MGTQVYNPDDWFAQFAADPNTPSSYNSGITGGLTGGIIGAMGPTGPMASTTGSLNALSQDFGTGDPLNQNPPQAPLSLNGATTTAPGGMNPNIATPQNSPADTFGETPINLQGGQGAFGDAWLRWTKSLGGDISKYYPSLQDALQAFGREYPEFGAQIGGSKGNKVTLGGQTYQAVGSAGDPTHAFAEWQQLDPNNPGAGGSMGGTGTNTLGGAGNVAGSTTGGSLPGWMLTPWSGHFQAPNPQDIQNDPYYQFQRDQGINAVQRSAAAKGSLLTGGTLKDLSTFNQGLAGSYEDKAYNRALGEYQLGKGEFYDTQDRPYNKLANIAGLGQTTGSSLASLGAGYAGTLGNLALDTGNVNAASGVSSSNAWQNYLNSLTHLFG